MYGAILGDIAGSRFEFDRGPWKKNFRFITRECSYTDDTVMTVAIAEALLDAGKDADISVIRSECIKSMKKWGKKYPYAGYGRKFYSWVLGDDEEPYNSLGNGSAMRVSAAGWLYDSLERTREVARVTAEVTHNHPEGIKGAECTAAVIFLARDGANKDLIKKYVTREFGYDMNSSLEELRAKHRHDETCMDALPKALVSFLYGESYEDTVRNAVSLGGDTDTIAAIAGSMAEAYFRMPVKSIVKCREMIEPDMLSVADRFDEALGRDTEYEYADNKEIEEAVERIYRLRVTDNKEDAYGNLVRVILERVKEGAIIPVPYIDVNGTFSESFDPEKLKAGDVVTVKEEVRLKMNEVKTKGGKRWVPLFTDMRAIDERCKASIVVPTPLAEIMKYCISNEEYEGVVINPFGKALPIPGWFVAKLVERFSKDK